MVHLAVAALNEAADHRQLHRIHDRADINALVQRIAHPKAVHPALQLGMEPIGNAFLHQKPRPGTADLAAVEPDRIDQAFNGAVNVCIVKYDIGRLAPQLQSQRLASACRRCADLAAHGGGACKGNLVHTRVRDQGRTGVAIAGDDVEHPFGQPRLTADLGKEQRGQGRVFGWLQHHRISCRQGRRDLPRQHQQRKVPRDHRPADAHGGKTWLLAVQKLGKARVIVEMPRH